MRALAALAASAQAADILTALRMQRVELNPVAAMLLPNPLTALAVKGALIVLVLAAMFVASRRHGTASRVVACVAILAGAIGAMSNV